MLNGTSVSSADTVENRIYQKSKIYFNRVHSLSLAKYKIHPHNALREEEKEEKGKTRRKQDLACFNKLTLRRTPSI